MIIIQNFNNPHPTKSNKQAYLSAHAQTVFDDVIDQIDTVRAIYCTREPTNVCLRAVTSRVDGSLPVKREIRGSTPDRGLNILHLSSSLCKHLHRIYFYDMGKLYKISLIQVIVL